MRWTRLLPLIIAVVAAAPFAVAIAQGDGEEGAPSPLEAPVPDEPLFPPELGPIVILEVPSPLPSLSAQTCNACHGEIHDQWAASGHATAATNPVYRAAVEALGDPLLCQDCHLPLEVQRPELARGPGGAGAGRVANPAYDPTLRLEGVTCAACHVREGTVVGPRELAVGQAPHSVRASASMRSAEACAFCHQLAMPGAEDHPYLDTVGEWRRSAFGVSGITCQECHMRRVSGVIAGSRYAAYASHEWTGNRDPAALARALTTQVMIRSASIQRGESLRATVTVQNTGAGHAVPTGDPSHQLELHVTVEDFAGELPKGAEAAAVLFERQMGEEAPFAELSDDRLQAGGSRAVDYAYQADKKSKPGRYVLVVTLNWWPVGAERAAAVGLDAAELPVQVSQQRIPFEVN